MASIHLDDETGYYRLMFRFGRKQFRWSLKTKSEDEADAARGAAEETLKAIERGWLPLPPDADFKTFVLSRGQLDARPAAPDVLTLECLFTHYEEQLPPGAMEANSLDTLRLHKKHLLRTLGAKQPVQFLQPGDLQGYINTRAKEKYRGKAIKANTIKKELATFRAVWNWAELHKLVTGSAPVRGLKYEKGDEKPPFMTWAEIERRIERGSLTDEQIGELWNSLFLRALSRLI